MQFDAVVCLTNSINEVLTDDETLQALHSMKSVLRDGGILVFDQGQTDATMKNPPKFDAVVNTRDWTRFFVLEYLGNTMTVNVFDFIHTETSSDFRHSKVHVRIRLRIAGQDFCVTLGSTSDFGELGLCAIQWQQADA